MLQVYTKCLVRVAKLTLCCVALLAHAKYTDYFRVNVD
jgi:hypothetical protein